MNPHLKVAYILLHFPYLTETFVAEEIHAIRSKGIDVQIVSLLEPGSGPVQPLSQELLDDTWYAPNLGTLSLWLAQLYFLLKRPSLYFLLLARLLRQPYPKKPLVLIAKRLMIFLKAVATAHYLRKSNVQLLHAHFAWLPGAGAWIISRLLDLPFTVTMHAYDIYASDDLINLISREANQLISISEYNRQQVLGLATCPPESISVIHCGVDLSKLEQPVIQNDNRVNGKLKIISVGSLVPKKGHNYLITACHLLKEQGIEFECSIIGGGPGEAKLTAQIEQYGLENHVRLLGGRPHPEILSAYQKSDIFVLACVVTSSGDRDGIPVVLMEAGAMGLPLVSTEVSGIPEIVCNSQTGCLVSPNDPEALAQAISTLAKDPQLRVELGKNAQRLVKTEFDIEVNASRLQTLFKNVIAG